jgi:hypothetical protein
MTKQQPPWHILRGKDVHECTPQGKVVHATPGISDEVADTALLEQVLAIKGPAKGPATVARLLAWRLRQPSPSRAVLDQIARMLDPSDDGYLKLRVVRHRKGRTATRYVNDAAMAKAVKILTEARGKLHGKQKKAVTDVAELFKVSRAAVLKALRSK